MELITKKILITGSTGFLGKHFIQYLNKHFPGKFQITESNTKHNSLLHYNSLKRYDGNLPDKNFDYIFHFAAVTKAGDWCLTHTGEQWLTNQQINTNIIRFWKEFCPTAKFIGIGTSCSYGDDWRKDEQNYLTYEPEPSLYTYAYTKRMMYIGLEAMNKQYGMDYCYFVPSTLYGTQFTESDNHFIYDIVRKVYSATYENNNNIEMWGSGLAKRELTWVDDFIELMLKVVFELPDKHNSIINIASGQEHSIYDYYKNICKIFNCDFTRIEGNKERYTGMKDNKLITTIPEIKTFKFKELENGLEELVKYYKTIKYD